MYGILVGILILDSLILAVAVLLQAGQGGGLASMGGGAGTETIMGGRQATTLLTKSLWARRGRRDPVLLSRLEVQQPGPVPGPALRA